MAFGTDTIATDTVGNVLTYKGVAVGCAMIHINGYGRNSKFTIITIYTVAVDIIMVIKTFDTLTIVLGAVRISAINTGVDANVVILSILVGIVIVIAVKVTLKI